VLSTSPLKTYNHFTCEDGLIEYFSDSPEAVLNKIFAAKSQQLKNAFTFSPALRVLLFKKIKSTLEASKEKLCLIYCEESGLSETRFLSELDRVLFQLDHFCAFLDRGALGDKNEIKLINGKEVSFKLKSQPIGQALVLGASNFPLAYSAIGGDVVSALAAGCSVVYKAHPFHIGTSSMVARIIESCLSQLSLSPCVYTHYVDDKNHSTTNFLLRSGMIDAVGFTGSQFVGRYLMDSCASLEYPIPVFAEMGSINPVVFLSNELTHNTEKYANLLAESITNDAGQFCTKPGVIFYPKGSMGEIFKNQLMLAVEKQAHFHMLHPSIQSRYQNSICQLTARKEVNVLYRSPGVNSIHGEKVLAEVSSVDFFADKELCCEVFGPFSLLVAYEDNAQLFMLLSKLDGQLTGTVIGNEKDKELEGVVDEFQKKCGRIILNAMPTGVNVLSTMQHGGPYPSSSDSRFTSVGDNSVWRFIRRVTFQNF